MTNKRSNLFHIALIFMIFVITGQEAVRAYSEIPVVEVIVGSYSAYEGKETVVAIRTASEWEKFWTLLKAETFPEPFSSAPKVDFNKEMVLACLLGVSSDGSYYIKVTRVEEAVGKLYVFLETGGGGGGTDAFTSPFHIIRLPKTDAPLLIQVTERSIKNYQLPVKEAQSFFLEAE